MTDLVKLPLELQALFRQDPQLLAQNAAIEVQTKSTERAAFYQNLLWQVPVTDIAIALGNRAKLSDLFFYYNPDSPEFRARLRQAAEVIEPQRRLERLTSAGLIAPEFSDVPDFIAYLAAGNALEPPVIAQAQPDGVCQLLGRAEGLQDQLYVCPSAVDGSCFFDTAFKALQIRPTHNRNGALQLRNLVVDQINRNIGNYRESIIAELISKITDYGYGGFSNTNLQKALARLALTQCLNLMAPGQLGAYAVTNQTIIASFTSDPEDHNFDIRARDAVIAAYLAAMRIHTTWAGTPEIRAFVDLKNVRLLIFTVAHEHHNYRLTRAEPLEFAPNIAEVRVPAPVIELKFAFTNDGHYDLLLTAQKVRELGLQQVAAPQLPARDLLPGLPAAPVAAGHPATQDAAAFRLPSAASIGARAAALPQAGADNCHNSLDEAQALLQEIHVEAIELDNLAISELAFLSNLILAFKLLNEFTPLRAAVAAASQTAARLQAGDLNIELDNLALQLLYFGLATVLTTIPAQQGENEPNNIFAIFPLTTRFEAPEFWQQLQQTVLPNLNELNLPKEYTKIIIVVLQLVTLEPEFATLAEHLDYITKAISNAEQYLFNLVVEALNPVPVAANILQMPAAPVAAMAAHDLLYGELAPREELLQNILQNINGAPLDPLWLESLLDQRDQTLLIVPDAVRIQYQQTTEAIRAAGIEIPRDLAAQNAHLEFEVANMRTQWQQARQHVITLCVNDFNAGCASIAAEIEEAKRTGKRKAMQAHMQAATATIVCMMIPLPTVAATVAKAAQAGGAAMLSVVPTVLLQCIVRAGAATLVRSTFSGSFKNLPKQILHSAIAEGLATVVAANVSGAQDMQAVAAQGVRCAEYAKFVAIQCAFSQSFKAALDGAKLSKVLREGAIGGISAFTGAKIADHFPNMHPIGGAVITGSVDGVVASIINAAGEPLRAALAGGLNAGLQSAAAIGMQHLLRNIQEQHSFARIKQARQSALQQQARGKQASSGTTTPLQKAKLSLKSSAVRGVSTDDSGLEATALLGLMPRRRRRQVQKTAQDDAASMLSQYNPVSKLTKAQRRNLQTTLDSLSIPVSVDEFINNLQKFSKSSSYAAVTTTLRKASWEQSHELYETTLHRLHALGELRNIAEICEQLARYPRVQAWFPWIDNLRVAAGNNKLFKCLVSDRLGNFLDLATIVEYYKGYRDLGYSAQASISGTTAGILFYKVSEYSGGVVVRKSAGIALTGIVVPINLVVGGVGAAIGYKIHYDAHERGFQAGALHAYAVENGGYQKVLTGAYRNLLFKK